MKKRRLKITQDLNTYLPLLQRPDSSTLRGCFAGTQVKETEVCDIGLLGSSERGSWPRQDSERRSHVTRMSNTWEERIGRMWSRGRAWRWGRRVLLELGGREFGRSRGDLEVKSGEQGWDDGLGPVAEGP